MFTRKKFLWNAKISVPRRTLYRKKTKFNESKKIKKSLPVQNNHNDLLQNVNLDELHNINENSDAINGNNTDEQTDFWDETIDEKSDEFNGTESFHEQRDCLDEPIYENSKISLRSSLLLIVAFCLKFHITNDGLENLLNLLCLHMPSSQNFPKSKYHFSQHFKAFSKQIKLYIPCTNCDYMLSDFVNFESGETKSIICPNCEHDDVYGRFTVRNKYFLTFDIKTQLMNILNNSTVQNQIWKKNCKPGQYSDITSGRSYNCLVKNEHDITLSLNTDGVPLFKSSSSNMWPIQLVINELPYVIRRKHIILGGLWLGIQSPDTEYFEQFIENFNLISDEGFMWNWRGKDIKSNVYTVLCTCDSIARCKLQNIVQFNGYYGCSWCEKSGISVEKGRGRMMSYAEESSASKLSNLRNLENVYDAAKLAVEKKKPVKGIKGPSCFSSLKNFDVVKSFVIDYMHCVCLGIVRSITMLWFESTQQDPFHINDSQKNLLNRKLSMMKTPSIIRRKPRKLNCIKYWKATEYLYWLLFYSPVFLIGILPSKFYRHWLLLVSSMHHLLNTHITNEQLNLTEFLLTKFVFDLSKLYGAENVTYNVHMLLHIPECIRNWGMLWNYSNFVFESFNGTLKKFVYGSQKAGYQIAQRFLTRQFVQNYYLMNSVEDIVVRKLLDTLVHSFRFKKNSKGMILGKSKLFVNNDLLSLFKGRKYSNMYSFKNVIYRGTRFTPKAREHVNNKKSANCIVFKEKKGAILVYLIAFKKNPFLRDIYCIVNLIECSKDSFFRLTDPRYTFDNIMTVDAIDENFTVWHLQDVTKIGILFQGKKEFIACVPGALERD